MENSVVFFELPADDLERAKNFYEKVFNWKITHNPGLDIYMLGTAASDQRGRSSEPGTINGLMAMRRNADSTICITIEVADIESAIASLKKYGGRITQEKNEIPRVGYAAYFKDPEGNTVQLFQGV
jgi:uncharacterized protein